MTLAYSVLGSGSRGNCTAVRVAARRMPAPGRSASEAVLRGPAAGSGGLFDLRPPPGAGASDGPAGTGSPAPQRVILFDCGLGRRPTRDRLGRVGLSPAAVTDVVMTHLDGDHLDRGWASHLAACDSIVVHLHRRHLREAERVGFRPRRLRVVEEGLAAIDESDDDAGTITIEPVGLPHDESGTTGWVIEAAGTRLGLATDLGRVPEALLAAFVDLDALLLESNYDPTLQERAPRPEFLRRRIMGGRGHLSNAECVAAIAAIARRSRLRAVTLLHLSRQCNDPSIVRSLVDAALPDLAPLVTIAHQHEPTPLRALSARPSTHPGAGIVGAAAGAGPCSGRPG
ncbi:MAG TPA: MBL fold metallo-hydrolase [Phycisphaerales bacterium]|nr:MBL fold metallo-hydrolase [Phycisphaerales bacterium]HMP36671.1 MBL fold metallo-hydrolase [Phycisphaerales bacterium]